VTALRDSAGLGFEIQTRLAAADNYNAWIAAQFRPYVGRALLDVGCALGNVTQFFLDRERVIAVDVAADFVDEIRRRFGDRPGFTAFQGDAADPLLPSRVAGEGIDTILCVNVLEHVEDDERALANFADILPPGGHLCLLVPAYPWLYGTMDEADDHFRRYTRAGLRSAVAAAGFRVARLRPFNLLGIAGWFLNGKILRRRLIPAAQYGSYNRLVPLLTLLERAVPPPAGLSLVCVAEKESS
jgi:SAM-dependent methyltransferase